MVKQSKYFLAACSCIRLHACLQNPLLLLSPVLESCWHVRSMWLAVTLFLSEPHLHPKKQPLRVHSSPLTAFGQQLQLIHPSCRAPHMHDCDVKILEERAGPYASGAQKMEAQLGRTRQVREESAKQSLRKA